MAKKVHDILWKLHEDTVNDISELEQSEDLGVWLDEQAALTVAYSNDLATVVKLLEQELSARGVSLKTH
jgi:hypothetical protein